MPHNSIRELTKMSKFPNSIQIYIDWEFCNFTQTKISERLHPMPQFNHSSRDEKKKTSDSSNELIETVDCILINCCFVSSNTLCYSAMMAAANSADPNENEKIFTHKKVTHEMFLYGIE